MRDFFKDSKARKGLASTLLVTVVIVALILGNVLLSTKDITFDVTANEIYTLSGESEKILKNLDQEVTIYIINGETDVDNSYAQIFEQYKKASKKVKLEYKDPDIYPNFVSQYTDDGSSEVTENSAVIVCGDKYRLVSADDYVSYTLNSSYSYEADSLNIESLFTGAINYVTSENTPIIYTLTGHSEKDLSDSLTKALETDNYSIESLSLLTESSVPEDCEILMINGAEKDLNEDELKAIRTYMENGGKLYISLDAAYGGLTNLNSLMEEYGIGVNDGVVVETDSSKYYQNNGYLLPDIQNADATSAQYNKNIYILSPMSAGLTDLTEESEEDDSTETSEETDTYTVTGLLTTSDSAYSKVNLKSSTLEKEKEDIDGPFDIAAAVSDETGGRMIVNGSVYMSDDSIDAAVNGANTDFIVNGINYLSEETSQISIRSKSLSAETAIVPAFQQKVALTGLVFILPVILIVFGIIVVIRRRRL